MIARLKPRSKPFPSIHRPQVCAIPARPRTSENNSTEAPTSQGPSFALRQLIRAKQQQLPPNCKPRRKTRLVPLSHDRIYNAPMRTPRRTWSRQYRKNQLPGRQGSPQSSGGWAAGGRAFGASWREGGVGGCCCRIGRSISGSLLEALWCSGCLEDVVLRLGADCAVCVD